MPRDYKHARRQVPPRKQAPGWVWLAAGLAIGLFVAFLVYLREHVPSRPGPPQLSAYDRERPSAPAAPPPSGAHSSAESLGGNSKPRFEFYTVLPEREVRVPEHELSLRTRKKTAAPNRSATYVLQVGSFRRIQEADRLRASLALIGLEAEIQSVAINGEDTWHRVRLGPFADLKALNAARNRLREHKMEALVLKDRP